MAATDQTLVVYLNELQMGVLVRKRGGKLEFTYDRECRALSSRTAAKILLANNINSIQIRTLPD